MIITKQQSKHLRYIARANYKSEVKGTESSNGKVKSRFFPVYGLSYDESKADKGMVELTNIKVLYNPFDGTYDELLERLHQILGTDEDAECEKVAETTDIPEPVKEGLLKTAETIGTLMHPDLQIRNSEVKGLSEDGTISVDVQGVIPNAVDHINVQIEAKPVETVEPSASEEPPVVETDFVGVPRNYMGKDATLTDAEIVEPSYAEVKEQTESAQKEAVESGYPKVTAEQKPSVHLDAAADGSHDSTHVVVPKKPTRGELYDLRIKCATMKLATSYGEKPDLDIGTIMARYPDASAKLTKFYAEDGIMPYTISEDAIREAYPDEFEALQ